MRRHDLAFVSPQAWRSLLAARPGLAAEPLVAGWVERGWPLVVRRALPGEAGGVPLGLPLPPAAGKRRLAILLPAAAVVSTAPPPALSATLAVAPPAWLPTLGQLGRLAARHGAEARVFGSLAWHLLTGLDYLTERSDLDFLLPLEGALDPRSLTAGLAAIETDAPPRLDGELFRRDGAAVNWRELHGDVSEILVKDRDGTALLDRDRFLGVAA